MTNPATSKARVFVFERYDPTEASLEWLRREGVELTLGYPMWESPFWRYTEDELIKMGQGHIAFMGGSVPITRRIMQEVPSLKFISKFGIGVDSIDLAAAKEHGISVSNTPEEGQAYSVSEHTVSMLLAFWKRLHRWNGVELSKGAWRGSDYAAEIKGKIVGLIGVGRIGRGVADRLNSWGVKIIAYDPNVSEAPVGVDLVDLNTLLETADAVSLHAASNNETFHIINESALARMKKTAILVNTGRGALVDYVALRRALATGQIAGAALDVFESEPPLPSDEVLTMPNVICTPHVAAWTKENAVSVGWRGARNVLAMIRGEATFDRVV